MVYAIINKIGPRGICYFIFDVERNNYCLYVLLNPSDLMLRSEIQP